MLHKRFACGLMAALAAVASAESDVAQLTQDTFDDFVKSNDLVLAECKSPQYPTIVEERRSRR